MKLSEIQAGADPDAAEQKPRLSTVSKEPPQESGYFSRLGQDIATAYRDFPRFEPPSFSTVKGATGELATGLGRLSDPGGLGRVGSDIKTRAGEMVGDFFGMLVGRAKGGRGAVSGQEAGGRFVDELGDIGMFASGGGAGPTGFPREQGPMSQLRSGMQRGPTPMPRVPDPGLALPPPGPANWRSTPAPAAEPSNLQMRPALPPPQMSVPGRPLVSTGDGIIPRSQPGTMTQPGAIAGAPERAPVPGQALRPGGVFSGTPGRTAADIAGEQAGRDLPPRAPGVEGRPSSRALPPLLPQGAERSEPSPFANALASNNPEVIDRKLAKQFREGIGVTPRERIGSAIDTKDQQLTTATDSIIENIDNIHYKDLSDPTGKATVPSKGRLPRSLEEFSQAISYLKNQFFEQYSAFAERMGGNVRIDLSPTINRLREFAADPENIHNPTIREQASRLADDYERQGSYSPLQAQNVIQKLNAELQSFLRKGTHTQEIFSHPTLMNEVRDQLLSDLNGTMERALGDPRYQVFRLRYGALASIEQNVGNALAKQMAGIKGLTEKGFTQAELTALFHGAIFFNPKIIGVSIASAASRELLRYLRSPNRAVTQMFNQRARTLRGGPYSNLTGQLSSRVGTGYFGPQLPQSGLTIAPQSQPYVGTSGP